MTFQPVVPLGGIGGWAFLSKTREAQEAAFQRSPVLTRDTDYFDRTIGTIDSAEALVADRRLLRVALGAFGLDADIDSKFFIRKVLEEGTLSGEGLANRLSDKRYFAFSKAFGFDLNPPATVISDFGTRIVARYRERQFEVAVGDTSPDMRLALGLDRELDAILGRGLSDRAAWFTMMATPPLRSVFERAFSLPAAFGAIDIDRQLEIFRDKAASVLGSSDFTRLANPEAREDLRRAFLVRSDQTAAPALTGSGAVALALLQSAQPAGLFSALR